MPPAATQIVGHWDCTAKAMRDVLYAGAAKNPQRL